MTLPQGPYHYEITARPDQHEGAGHVYIVDASGRKIASMWGKPDEKIALANLVIDAAAKLQNARRVHRIAAAEREEV